MNNQALLTFLIALPAAFLMTALLCRLILPVLRRRRIGQHIFADYVAEHKGKEGTPTMGGIGFIVAVLLLLVPFFVLEGLKGGRDLIPLALTVCLGVANAMIGFADDYTKLSHKQNQGLTSWQKLLLQIVVAALYLYAMSATGHLDTILRLPSFGVAWDMGIGYYVVALLLIVGVVNSTNLTDGIDGLAATLAALSFMCLVLISTVLADVGSVMLSALMVGAMLGFLVFNFHPAKVFMGDTGSLFIGAMLVGSCFALQRPLAVVLLGLPFILDMLTSLIQIVCYHAFHHVHVFPVAPIHHWFQRLQWSEEKIVFGFSTVGLLSGAIAVIAVLIRI